MLLGWAEGSTLSTLVTWGGVFTLVAGIVGVLWRAVRGVFRTAARMNQFIDDWYGEPGRPGVPERPGMMERVQAIEGTVEGIDGRVKGVEHELHPNGGDSLRDAVNQANSRLQRLCPDQPEPECPPPNPPGEA